MTNETRHFSLTAEDILDSRVVLSYYIKRLHPELFAQLFFLFRRDKDSRSATMSAQSNNCKKT